MQERGINSTFKKIIYESTEIVFLADDSYPYSIFYANESFEEQIGATLKERTLVGLGLDINAYIFKEELILTHDDKDYSFRLELPQENSSHYYLFYKGKEIKVHGLPNRREALQFFRSNLDLIAIGQHDYLTYLNHASLPVLGYDPVELINTTLCSFIHEGDLEEVRNIWKSVGENERLEFLSCRFRGKDGRYRHLECSVQFTEDKFFIIAKDNSVSARKIEFAKKSEALKLKGPDISKIGVWQYDPKSGILEVDSLCSQLLENQKLEIEWLRTGLISKLNETENKGEILEFSINSEESRPLFSMKAERIQEEGLPETWLGILWDETSIRALQKQRGLFENIIIMAPEAMVVTRNQGEIFLCNEEARQLFGINKEQKFKHLSELNRIFEESNQWKEWIESANEDGNSSRFSTTLISPLGKQLNLEISSKIIEHESERFVCLSFKNISEKISLERTLEESSDFLMNLTEQVPGGLYQLVLDGSGKMTFSFLSKGIASVLGLKVEEIEQFSDISVAISRVHPFDLPQVIMTSVASAKREEPWQCQFRVKDESDPTGYRWILGAARPQSLPNGDMVWYGYLADISNQKEFETKLDEARKSAEKANQIKSDFLSMISHELRTPLNAISGSVYSLLQEQPTKNQKSTLNTINFAVENLIIMINDLLDFQKIEAGKLTIEKAVFQLDELINQVLKGLSFHARDSRNKLELHLSSGLDLMVKGDKTRLSQILNNLITNALKFTNEGNVDVTVQLKEKKDGKVRVYFEVKDTGIGIALENQEKIFNDFDQVKPTFSTKYGGTGLGLSITRKLLNLMGSNIGLLSAEGEGSTFFFDLDFELATVEKGKFTSSNDKLEDLTKLHLLMAEDNDVNSLVLGKIIKKWGYTFERVHNGAEAIEAVKKSKYDCILMDIQMPVMDGFEATVEIKKLTDTPVIALTAAAKLEIMEKIEECGFNGFVAKPIDAAELLKKIKEVIQDKNHNF